VQVPRSQVAATPQKPRDNGAGATPAWIKSNLNPCAAPWINSKLNAQAKPWFPVASPATPKAKGLDAAAHIVLSPVIDPMTEADTPLNALIVRDCKLSLAVVPRTPPRMAPAAPSPHKPQLLEAGLVEQTMACFVAEACPRMAGNEGPHTFLPWSAVCQSLANKSNAVLQALQLLTAAQRAELNGMCEQVYRNQSSEEHIQGLAVVLHHLGMQVWQLGTLVRKDYSCTVSQALQRVYSNQTLGGLSVVGGIAEVFGLQLFIRRVLGNQALLAEAAGVLVRGANGMVRLCACTWLSMHTSFLISL
jgi:hypothetical protein